MKKLLLVVALFVIVGMLALGWGSIREVGAQIIDYFTADADMGPFYANAKNSMTKEEFMIKRAEGINLRRGLEGDRPVDPLLRVEAIQEMDQQEADARSLAPQVAWTEIGPNPIPNGQVGNGPQLPVSGRTTTIAVHPTNPNLVYVGTAQGGLYRTSDGGTTWTPMLDSALSLAVNRVAIAPSQPDTIFVGTGESSFSGTSFFGVGIYRIDNASTAAPIITGPIGGTNFTGRAIGGIAVHPTNANIIFASSTSGIRGIGQSSNNVLAVRGLFRSTDALSAAPTFTKLTLTGLAAQTRDVLDIVMDPGNPDLVLCTVADSFGAGEGGVYRSINALAMAPSFVRTFTAGVGIDASRTELALHRSGGGVVTVYAASGFNGGTLQRSVDGGATFTQRIDNNFCTAQCFYDIAVDVDPTNANNVYLGGSPTLVFGRSTNGGTSFTIDTQTAVGLHVDSHAIAIAPSNPLVAYFGSDGGIYRTSDVTATPIAWTSLNNTTFRATQFMGLAVHPIDPNFTIGGTQDNGTNFYQPSALWTRADFGDGGYAVIDQSSVNNVAVNMYHTYFNAPTLKGYGFVPGPATATEGLWAFRGCNGVAGNGIPCGGNVLFYAPLEQGPGTPNSIYYGADTLYRSGNTGTTHVAASQNFVNPISSIGISPQNDSVRFVGTNTGQIFGTTTGANPLVDMDPGNTIPNNFVARTVVDPNNVNTAYVTLSAFGIDGIWKTTTLSSLADNIAPTWTSIQNGLPQIPMNAFVVDPLNSNNIYVGTDIGVFFSTNAGTSWLPLGSGLPRVAVFDMAVAPGSVLRIATHGRGMWQIPIASPTMANVSLSGRVMTDGGRGVSGSVVVMTDSNGGTRTARTGSFGYYRIEDVPSGETYVVSVASKRYVFSPKTVTVSDDVADFDFIAQ